LNKLPVIEVSTTRQSTSKFPVHWVSKEARYKLIELMLSTRSLTELAKILGVTPTAVRKYIKRSAHPSDEVLLKAIESLAPYEKDQAMSIIISDLLGAVKALYENVEDKYRAEIKSKLAEIIK
jgi:predicted transcriptional regulator